MSRPTGCTSTFAWERKQAVDFIKKPRRFMESDISVPIENNGAEDTGRFQDAFLE
jgi:hypothetical protein